MTTFRAGRKARPHHMTSYLTSPGIKNTGLIILRLITFSLICGLIIGWLAYPSYLQGPLLGYGFITLALFLTMFFQRRWRAPLLLHLLMALHFISEISCEAGIVYTTGNLYSPFAALFLLTIVSAALIYRLVGTLLVATAVSIAYVGVVWINYGLFAGGPTMIFGKGAPVTGDDTLFYSTFLHILIFYLVAFIAGYLAQKLQTRDRQLNSASVELYRARLATGDILRHLNSGLLTMTGQGEIVFFNHAAESILGLEGADVSGRDCRNVFSGRLAPLADGLLFALASGQQTARQEFEISDLQGRVLPIGVSTSILLNQDGTARGLIAIFQDLTQAKIMEERMRHADRMAVVGELAASMAHEIRNPLAAISGSVEVLKNDLTVSGDDEKLMSLIITETGRLNTMLSDFLMYARVGRMQFQKIEVQRIISDTIEIVRRHPSFSSSMTIEVEAAGELTYISGDADQLKQLLLNLAVNACEVMGETGGVIQFGATPFTDPDGEHMVAVTVRDTGPGIPAEILDKIFLPFFSTKKKGTGLGLAIVSRLIEAHNGRIEVSSILGHGTEFRLYFQGLADDGVVRHLDAAESLTNLR